MTEKNSETLTLDEKLILLAKVAAGKKGVISSEELMNYFKDDQLSPEQLDYVYEFLDSHKIDVLNTDESDDSAPEFFMKDDNLDEEETEEDLEQLTIPEGIAIDDPVRMYLKDIGKIQLLTVEMEQELAGCPMDLKALAEAKRTGFSDRTVGKMWELSERDVFELRRKNGILRRSAKNFDSYVAYGYEPVWHGNSEFRIP